MADNELPGTVATRTRDEYRDLYRRDYQFFAPDADTGPGTQPFVDASLAADQAQILFNDAIIIGNGTNLDTSTGTWLRQRGDSEGVTPPLPAAGGSGFVIVSTSVGGSTIAAGTELRHVPTGLRYLVVSTALYANNALVPINGLDTGVETNLDAGVILTFTSPPPGCAPTAAIYEQSDGSGLTGGRAAETDAQYRERIKDHLQDPPAAGNDAEYQATVEALPGIGIRKCWTYPAIFGPGTTAFAFTLRQSSPGDTRIPNGAQLNAALAGLEAKEPADDGIFALTMLAQNVRVAYRLSWSSSATGWNDAPPWPPYGTAPVAVEPVPTPAALSCRVSTASAITDPLIGQSIAFFDSTTRRFVRKRIATVTEITPDVEWDLTFTTDIDAAFNAYVPVEEQYVSPWSDSLAALVEPTLLTFDATGPGEMYASFVDPGRRQKRNPPSPESWPSVLTQKMLVPILQLPQIADAVVVNPTLPLATAIGVPGATVSLLTLRDLAAYPQ